MPYEADCKFFINKTTGEWTVRLGKVNPLHERVSAMMLISKILKRKPDAHSLKLIEWKGVEPTNLTLPLGK